MIIVYCGMNADGRDKRGFAAWAWVDLLLTAEVGPPEGGGGEGRVSSG